MMREKISGMWVMNMRKRAAAAVLLGLFLVPLAMADYVYTPVTFTVASSLAFTVTLPGQSPVSSLLTSPGTATTTIYFNSSSMNQDNIQPCANPDFASNCQNESIPILNFTNTGTATFNMTMRYNQSLESGITSTYNSSCSGGGCAGVGAMTELDSTEWHRLCQGLPPTSNNWCAVWLYANFTNLPAGTYTNAVLENSTLEIANP